MTHPSSGRVPTSADPDVYPFAFTPSFRLALHLVGVRPDSCDVRVLGDELTVRFGPWRLVTPLSNVRSADVGGPYRAWKVLGARLSLADRGLTFGTNPTGGACIGFHRPVPGLEPTGLLRHPAVTVTVAEPQLLVDRLRHHLTGPDVTGTLPTRSDERQW